MRTLDQAENFLGLDQSWCDFERAQAVVLPAPYEHSTSYGEGAGAGPQAILAASQFVELYDEALDGEPFRWTDGIATLAPVDFPRDLVDAGAVAAIHAQVKRLLQAGKFVVTLGGEHTIAVGAAQAHAEIYPNLSVLQLDAHSDLRDAYEGNPYSHACAMRRIYECHPNIVQVGIRSQCREEAEFIRAQHIPTFYMHQLRQRECWVHDVIEQLNEHVYLTFDYDALDPSLMPAVGTPEPGGLLWDETLRFLRQLTASRTLVGFDVNELAPTPPFTHPQFTAAKLIYKLLGYVFQRGSA